MSPPFKAETLTKACVEAKIATRARDTRTSGLRDALKLAGSRNCLDLGAGTCKINPDRQVFAAAEKALSHSIQSYAPLDGVEELRSAIASHYAVYNRLQLAPHEVAVTCGATGAFEAVCKCFIEPGDEVISFEPFYQYHVRQVLERGGILRYVRLRPPDWSFSLAELEDAISARTKLLVLTNPNNPTGKVFSRADLESIAEICKAAGILVVSDEVYEHIVQEDSMHVSIAGLPGMFEQTLTISSAGKTFFVTGWRVGWITGPANIVSLLALKSDETNLCAPTPLQYAVAECLKFENGFFARLASHFSSLRRRLLSSLEIAGFEPYDSQGAFYVLAGYRQLGYHNDLEAMNEVLDKFGIATVPGGVFFQQSNGSGMLRFCFAVEDEVVEAACNRLKSESARFNSCSRSQYEK
jgi:aspartate/methionine/tyrosine aminotransferase